MFTDGHEYQCDMCGIMCVYPYINMRYDMHACDICFFRDTFLTIVHAATNISLGSADMWVAITSCVHSSIAMERP